MRKIGLVRMAVLAAFVIMPAPAAGQPPAGSLGDLVGVLAPRARVTVTLRDGTRLNGRVEAVEPHELRLRRGGARRVVPAAQLDEVRARGDRLWNGALIGAGIGALGGAFASNTRPRCRWIEDFCGWIGAGLGAPIGAAVGAAVDAAFPNRRLLYARPGRTRAAAGQVVIQPALTPTSKAVRLVYLF